MPVVGDEHVRRLDVAVHQPAAVHGGDAVDQLDGEVEHAAPPRSGPAGQHLVERPAAEELADQERLAVLLARVVHRADVRMADERRDVRFAAEAVARFRGLGELGRQQLDRDVAIEPQIARAVDRRVLVAPQPLEQPVVRDGVARFRGVGR